MELIPFHELYETFQLREKEIITLVGAGGKTTVMYALAKELARMGKNVITTTTTQIMLPSEEDTELLITDLDGKIPPDAFSRYKHVTCVARPLKHGKAKGVTPGTIKRWPSTLDVDYIIVEGDGSKGRPLKAPADYEPVIPLNTTLYVPMVGGDALGRELNSENVHRPHIVAKLASVSVGDKVTPRVVGDVIKHYLEMPPNSSRSLVYINKVSTQHQVEQAISIANELKGINVVFGSVFKRKYWLVKQ